MTLEEIKAHKIDDNLANAQLRNLYESKWEGYQSHIYHIEDSTNPYLVAATDQYLAAPRKVMALGQETLGWGGEFDKEPSAATIDNLMRLQDDFANRRIGYASPFWQFLRRLKYAAPNAGMVFNNVVKIGRLNEAGCNDEVNALALEHFNVLRVEIDILKPDVLLFFSGTYDWRIRLALGEFDVVPIEGYAPRAFARLQFADPSLPSAWRSYHPRGLRMQGVEASVFEELLKIVV